MSPLQVTFSLICIVVVIIGAYYATYYVGARASGKTRPAGYRDRNISVIDRFAISRDKSFYLIEIAGKVYVVGVATQGMTLLDTIDAAAFHEAAANQRKQASQAAPYQQGAQGSGLRGRIIGRLAAMMSARMGRPAGAAYGMPADPAQETSADPAREASADPMREASAQQGGRTFAQSMEDAGAKDGRGPGGETTDEDRDEGSAVGRQ